MQAVKRVLRYLKGTKDFVLHVQPCNSYTLTGYSDADWACNRDDRRSTAGHCVYFGSTLVSWSSKKQHVIARSSAESEYRSLAQVVCEITWLESLLKELLISVTEVPVTWCDNLSAGQLASNPVFHARTKHIDVDIHFVRDKVLEKKVEVSYVPSQDEIVDYLTKALTGFQFYNSRTKLGVIERPLSLPSLKGNVKASTISKHH